MGGGNNTSTSTTGSSSQTVTDTTSKLLRGLSSQYDKGTAVFGQSLYPGMSATTTGGINATTAAAKAGAGGLNSAYDWAKQTVGAGGYNPALTSAQTGIQDYLKESQADAPGYAGVRQKALDDGLGGVAAAFQGNGRFGSSVMGDAAGTAATNAVAGLDYQNYTDRLGRMLGGNQALAGIGQTAMGNAGSAASAIPGLYQATLQPGQTQIAAGQLLDADALARRQGENDLFRRTNDAGWDTLGRASSILGGTAGSAGTTSTTSTPSTPWWQSVLGAAVGFA